ncbi:MAG: Extracellular solute-binding protein, family 5 [Microgenomates group bacterium GW2011_GWF2_45_18]|nr:MAG: Extracellular solute-binding protein, family 5 [Microgenomates group bacterium GW2011_GWF1_44_10]KKU02237.1 MAG: Extracellular solute-binding protein, family 5 [Microgenomates group bacterium GW2011_GWF2_45_18]OGJ40924.1 MAG: hypothetical protein A2378_03250 [Candidatus Pacebacteria bacterium RIFOXYB1_FULL_44_10]HAU98834.1 hypothetical protein [Candidatus Paceibacterota bacterium]HAX01829.1 hypothetical protein [Candidatus Paceibacterota bacterium]
MKTLRKTYWYVSSYLEKHGKLLFVAILGSTVFLGVLLFFLPKLFSLKPRKYIGIIGQYTLTSLPLEIQNKMSRGLTTSNEDGEIIPDLVSRWSVENDGKQFRFLLKENLEWADGTAVTSASVLSSFRDTESLAQNNELLYSLKEPFAPFPSVMIRPIFLAGKEYPVGFGPYSVRKVTKIDDLLKTLELESVDTILVYRFYSTEEQAKMAYKEGKIDQLSHLTNADAFEQWKQTTIHPEIRFDRYVAIFFNLQDPRFEKPVRQALNYALSKPPSQVRAVSPYHPNHWSFNPAVKKYEKDQEKAIELLIHNIPAQPLSLELTTSTHFSDLADAMKQEWETFGARAYQACITLEEIKNKEMCSNVKIELRVKISNFPDLASYQILLIGQQIPLDPDQYTMWHSTQTTNFTHYHSPKVDKLLEDGRKTIDQLERKTIYAEVQQYLAEDSPAIFLQHPIEYSIARTSFRVPGKE